jgi:hypothetical protein|tara:strand:- start:627 stop:1121 length:495 start_codon:yes stop_codon:yes gene_type:complete
MNLSIFDQTRKDESNSYGESVRLSNELRAVIAHQVQRIENTIYGKEELKTINIPAKWGFDCESAPYSDFNVWLNDHSIKKSQSLFWFVIRIMLWRFPEMQSTIRSNMNEKNHLEFDLILSEMKRENEWCGLVSYSNMVRLDGSLTNNKNKVISMNDDRYKVKRK